MTYAEQTMENAAQTVIKGLERRNMTGEYCRTADDARAAIARYLVPGSSVSWGRTATLEELGAIDMIYNSGCKVYDRFAFRGDKEKTREIFKESLFCDTYFMSANAISMDGILVNIDGHGGRVAYLAFGPEKVVVVAGMNKVAPDLDSAVKRARNVAAPTNITRQGCTTTPCAGKGKCYNCLSEDCICCQVLITRRSRVKDRIHVILVGERLGF
ncbi:MAG: lactate utilization protein [Oscillospiraceae bacterium]